MSRLSFLLALLAIGVIGGANGHRLSRIRGGDLAVDNEFAGTVTLVYPGNFVHTCGGGIIGRRHVLTAAHCVDKRKSSDIAVRAGIHDIRDRDNDVEINVTKVIIHPDYISQTDDRIVQNDLALLVLEKDLPLGSRIMNYLLPNNEPPAGAYFIAGWGANDDKPTEYQFQLKKLTMIFDSAKCHGFVPQTFCVYAEQGAACPGDSGSPLVKAGRIYGIASTATCQLGSTATFTNVHNFIDWITTNVKENP